MIAFGVSIAEPEPYRRYAEPGIRAVAEPDSDVLAFAAVGTLGRTYNLLLDAAATREDLEALVLVDPQVEIADARFCEKVRAALRDPNVGVVGCAGATGVPSIAWWEGSVSAAPVVLRYEQHGGGEVPAFGWAHPAPPGRQVETVDGFLLLVLSPWVVRNVRFDEALRLNYGFDLDYCRQVRQAGRTVVTADLRVIWHHSLELIGDPAIHLWMEAHAGVADKWEPDGDEEGWKERARRAEAEREAARAVTYSRGLAWEARIGALERRMDELTSTTSWRVTAPLRRLNALRARTVARGRGR
jgi:hypothetical protein